ncbi:MAG TPA: glycerol-3-phosphate acyltransferase [Dehalococcoidia bacterium]|jgi:glycerol-3-phosphate acyltransferase PlsY|nr:glycerol-3-phosphate acyltransferase [Dehalococcoidia bacterium]
MTLAVVLVAAYLLGSIPTSYIVVYRYTGRDIREMGTGNPGAMNVFDSVGLRPAIIVGVIDVLKGMAAVGVAYIAGASDLQAVLAAAVAIMGHDYSVFLRLHGGNGTATAVGALAFLVPLPTIIAASFAAAAVLVVGSRRIAGMAGLLSVPALAFWFDAPDTKVLGSILILTITALKIIRFEGFSRAKVRYDE